METPTKEYLQSLLNSAHQKFSEYSQPNSDGNPFEITYLPTKNHNFMGLKDGLDGLAQMQRYKVKESSCIRSNSMYYHKIYKIKNKVMKIDSFVGGHNKLDVSYFAHYENDYRYIFPYTSFNTKSLTYMIVTHYKNDNVYEEYMVEGNQIVYEKYDYIDDNIAEYYYINYVPTATYPVIAELKGRYIRDTLEYIQDESYVWYENK